MPTQHITETTFLEGMKFSTTINGHQIIIDADIEVGGINAGPRPKPLMLSSLAGCTGMDVVSLLKKMHVNFSHFTIEVKGDLRDEHPKIYTQIYLTYNIKVEPTDKEKVEKAVKLSEERYCGVSAMLRMICPIEVKVNFL